MSLFRDSYGDIRGGVVFGGGVALLLAIVIFFAIIGSFMGQIDAGERGIRTSFGKIIGVVQPGLYFKVPIKEDVIKMNVQPKTVKYELENPLLSSSKDLQDVKISVVMNYRVDPSKVDTIYQKFETMAQYEEKIIRPSVRDTVKAVASQFTAEELVTKRPEFTDKVVEVINERLSGQFATTESMNITNFEFSESFTQAIEAKVTAEQNALAAKNKLEQSKYEADQRIAQARGEAEAIRIQAQAITQQGGDDYVRLKAIEKWSGNYPTTMIGGNAIPLIQIAK